MTPAPAHGDLIEGRGWVACQKTVCWMTAAALEQLQADMAGSFKRAFAGPWRVSGSEEVFAGSPGMDQGTWGEVDSQRSRGLSPEEDRGEADLFVRHIEKAFVWTEAQPEAMNPMPNKNSADGGVPPRLIMTHFSAPNHNPGILAARSLSGCIIWIPVECSGGKDPIWKFKTRSSSSRDRW